MRRWRIPTWLLLGWTALTVVGVVDMDKIFFSKGGQAATQEGLEFMTYAVAWFVAFVVLAIVWIWTRLRSRPRP
jgi:hypothetical protein